MEGSEAAHGPEAAEGAGHGDGVTAATPGQVGAKAAVRRWDKAVADTRAGARA